MALPTLPQRPREEYSLDEIALGQSIAAYKGFLVSSIAEQRAGGDYNVGRSYSRGSHNLLRHIIADNNTNAVFSTPYMNPSVKDANDTLSHYGLAPLQQGELEKALPLARQKTLQGIKEVSSEVIREIGWIEQQAVNGLEQLKQQPSPAAVINPQQAAANEPVFAAQTKVNTR